MTRIFAAGVEGTRGTAVLEVNGQWTDLGGKNFIRRSMDPGSGHDQIIVVSSEAVVHLKVTPDLAEEVITSQKGNVRFQAVRVVAMNF